VSKTAGTVSYYGVKGATGGWWQAGCSFFASAVGGVIGHQVEHRVSQGLWGEQLESRFNEVDEKIDSLLYQLGDLGARGYEEGVNNLLKGVTPALEAFYDQKKPSNRNMKHLEYLKLFEESLDKLMLGLGAIGQLSFNR